MYVYMLMLLVLLLLVALLNPNIETFTWSEYPVISEGLKPPHNSCVNLLASKGWIDMKDKSLKAQERKSIIADMEITRIPQTLFSNTIHPNIDACTFGNDVMSLYYNAKGRNIIDPNTCEMRGITADNVYVNHQLEKISSHSPLNPKGCMINFEGMDKASFEKLVDDAYKLKMYPELKEKKEYRDALIALSENNTKLKNKMSLLEAENNRYNSRRNREKIDLGDLDSESITGTCRDAYTQWDEAGGWGFNFLDRHRVKCNDGEVLSKFKLETAYYPDRTRYKYRCCKIDTSPIPRKIKESSKVISTGFENSQMWNTMGLTSHSVKCQKEGEAQSMLKGFKLESQYVDIVKSNAKYDFECTAHQPYGLINKSIKTTCRKTKTPENDLGPTFNYLDRHDVQCNDGEGISDFALRTDGSRFYYDYTCCKPEIVSNE